MAEDFAEVFGYGRYDPTGEEPETEAFIAANDVAGVALMGVKALLAKVEQLEAKVASLEARVG